MNLCFLFVMSLIGLLQTDCHDYSDRLEMFRGNQSTGGNQTKPKPKPDPKPKPGKNISITEVPWQVAIIDTVNPKELLGGGAIINERWVITTPVFWKKDIKSITDKPLADFVIRAGSEHFNKGGCLHDVIEILVHKDFRLGGMHDNFFALMKVAPRFQFDTKTDKVNLSDKKDHPIGKTFEAIAWSSELTTLVSVPLKVVKNNKKDCDHIKNIIKDFTNSILCTMVDNGQYIDQYSCGAPLVDLDSKTLYGIGFEFRNSSSLNSVFSFVPEAVDWINEKSKL